MTWQPVKQLAQRRRSRQHREHALNRPVCRHPNPAREPGATGLFALPERPTAIRDQCHLNDCCQHFGLGTAPSDEVDSGDIPLTHGLSAQPLQQFRAVNRSNDVEVGPAGLKPDPLLKLGNGQLGARGLLLQDGRPQRALRGSRKFLGDADRERGEVVIAQAAGLATVHG